MYIKNHCILHIKSTDKAALFAFKFGSIYTKKLPNIHTKLDPKCINFRYILQSVKTVGIARTKVHLFCKNLKEHGAAYPILHAELPPIGRRRLITLTMEDNIVKLLIWAPTHYL